MISTLPAKVNVTGLGFKLSGSICDVQSWFEVDGCWLCFVKEIVSVFATIWRKNRHGFFWPHAGELS